MTEEELERLYSCFDQKGVQGLEIGINTKRLLILLGLVKPFEPSFGPLITTADCLLGLDS